MVAVETIELIPNLKAPGIRPLKQHQGARGLPDLRGQQAIPREQAIEATELVNVVQVLEVELFVNERRFVAMVESECDKIAHDPP